MGLILPQKIKVKLNNSTINYYEKLGYNIPRSKNSEGRIGVSPNTIIEVDVNDLPYGSSQLIDIKCDCCKKKKQLHIISIIKI